MNRAGMAWLAAVGAWSGSPCWRRRGGAGARGQFAALASPVMLLLLLPRRLPGAAQRDHRPVLRGRGHLGGRLPAAVVVALPDAAARAPTSGRSTCGPTTCPRFGPHLGDLAQLLGVAAIVAETLGFIADRLRRAESADARRLRAAVALQRVSTAMSYDLEPATATPVVADWRVSSWAPPRHRAYLLGPDGALHGRRVVDTATPVSVDDKAEGRPDGGRGVAHGRRGRGIAPVRVPPARRCHDTLGVIELKGVPGELDDFTRNVTETFTVQAGLALERTWSRARLVDSSLHDELTGLNNRRWAMAALTKVASGDAVVLIDLDHFKDVNDRQGHRAGDEVLRTFARYLDRTLRAGDDVARFGGEEFLVVMRQAGPDVLLAAERVRAGWESIGGSPTYSAGVAVHLTTESVGQTLERADLGLYEAKRSGRNRVCMGPSMLVESARAESERLASANLI